MGFHFNVRRQTSEENVPSFHNGVWVNYLHNTELQIFQNFSNLCNLNFSELIKKVNIEHFIK